MRFATPLDYTFMGHLQNVHYCKEVADEEGIKNMLDNFRHLSKLVHHTLPLFFVIDYSMYQYLFMTESIKQMADYDPREFLEGGLDMLIEIYQKEDFKVYNENIFTSNMQFLKNTPQEDHHKYVFSYNYRIKSKSGELVQIFQRGSYITSKETGLPIYSLGMALDISAFKRDTIMTHTIEKAIWENGIISKKVVASNFFYPYHQDTLLTKQEKKVLQWVSEGFSSKMLADKLYISENTVANHRKNMLKKTNTKNVAELVSYALKNKII